MKPTGTPRNRRYIAPHKLDAIKFDIAKLLDEREDRGEDAPSSALLSTWTGHSEEAIARARKELGR